VGGLVKPFPLVRCRAGALWSMRGGDRGPASVRVVLDHHPVVTLKMSALPKLLGHAASGQGAGKVLNPSSRDCWRKASTAGQLAMFAQIGPRARAVVAGRDRV